MNASDQLVLQLEKYNKAYRRGRPLITDAQYDQLVEELRRIDPRHPFLKKVEPEEFLTRREVRHPLPMLSLEKAYLENARDLKRLRRFVGNVQKEAAAMGLAEPRFEMTAKLDGLAGRDDGTVFASRGNGLVGYEISSAFEKGVVPIGGRGEGLGEIVVQQSYFEAHLAGKFEHPRNMVVGIVASDSLNAEAVKALQAQKVHFVPYSQLPSRRVDGEELLQNLEKLSHEVTAACDYPLDGVVVSVVDDELKQRLGATTHHYRWQIAVKRKGQTARTTVKLIQWQVGRTGNITPVMKVKPVTLSGATIRRVTAHNAGMVVRHQIGCGARIEVIRSGEVIPKLEKVIAPSAQVLLPKRCPSCAGPLHWRGDFLRCGAAGCSAQIEQRICHWFRILGSADWFGIKSIQKLVAQGFDSLEKIYAMGRDDFVATGFGPVQSRNLAQALTTSRTKPVEDWRFLAAFGITDLGIGDSRKLLRHMTVEQIPEIEAADLLAIKGFGQEKSRSIPRSVAAIKEQFRHMLALNFNLLATAEIIADKQSVESPIAGKRLVFSGKMEGGGRAQMQATARQLGAQVQSAVSRATDMLVCGAKAGGLKLDKATMMGVRIVSEAEYNILIKGRFNVQSKVRAHVIISGRVQGVFFRVETQRAVKRIGAVRGWVRNRPEGTVEALFEGTSAAVDKVLAWCRNGSPNSRVDDVKVEWEEFTGEYDTFSIT